MKAMILVVEDDHTMSSAIKFALEMADYHVLTASDGEEALFLLNRIAPDLIVSDISMPWLDGIGFYERLRQDPRWIDTPVIFLTGCDDWSTTLNVKSMGADDFLRKPFKQEELLASIKGRLRRARELRMGQSNGGSSGRTEHGTVKVGDVQIDPAAYQVTRGQESIDLTPTEFNLLLCLARRAGEVLSPEEIIRSIFQDESALYDTGDRVRVHIKNLRRKLEPDPANPTYIQNVRGVGYILNMPAT